MGVILWSKLATHNEQMSKQLSCFSLFIIFAAMFLSNIM